MFVSSLLDSWWKYSYVYTFMGNNVESFYKEQCQGWAKINSRSKQIIKLKYVGIF